MLAIHDPTQGREQAENLVRCFGFGVPDRNRTLFSLQNDLRLRHKGSIHTDAWEGPAADLAAKRVIGVAPAIGWWRERYQFRKWTTPVRYALLLSLDAGPQEVDLYTPLANALKVPMPVAITA